MLTGELRSQIDLIWNDFWSGGLSNPLQVIEQITYLIFIKRLDEMQELEERKATTLGKPMLDSIERPRSAPLLNFLRTEDSARISSNFSTSLSAISPISA
jgi:hypothetical protein